MFAFSTCWNSRRHTDGREMLLEIRKLGFECAELGHGTRLSLVDGIGQAVRDGEIKIASVHNFCPLPVGFNGPAPDAYKPSSRREAERTLAVRHTLRTIDFAASVGAKFVVLHLGSIKMRHYTGRLVDMAAGGMVDTPKYERVRKKAIEKRFRKRQKYLDNVYASLEQIVPRAKELGVILGIETRMDIEDIPSEQEAAEIVSHFGPDVIRYWLDTGHACLKERLGLLEIEPVLERFAGRLGGMHLQDFNPPVFDHLPPGKGVFDFSRLVPYLTNDMVLAWEISPQWSFEELRDVFGRVHDLLHPPTTTPQ